MKITSDVCWLIVYSGAGALVLFTLGYVSGQLDYIRDHSVGGFFYGRGGAEIHRTGDCVKNSHTLATAGKKDRT
jgi:hypothetical protein